LVYRASGYYTLQKQALCIVSDTGYSLHVTKVPTSEGFTKIQHDLKIPMASNLADLGIEPVRIDATLLFETIWPHDSAYFPRLDVLLVYPCDNVQSSVQPVHAFIDFRTLRRRGMSS
jgi:hypothetical protein